MTEDLDWAGELLKENKYAMHIPSRVIGKVVGIFDGVTEKYVSPITNAETKGPVIQFERGHTFVAHKEQFQVLGPREVAFFQAVQSAMASTLKECAVLGAKIGTQGQTGFVLLASALREQLVQIERTFPDAHPPEVL